MDKETRALLKAAEKQGCKLKISGNSHTKILRDGKIIAIAGCSSSDWRGLKNLRASLRRQGVNV
jgi:hypothetical protein